MPAYRLISFKACPWVQRAAIVLREKGLPFAFTHIEPDDRPPWLAENSPHGKVPVLLIDESTALFESNAISEYLDEIAAPRLHPEDAVTRAFHRAWSDTIPVYAATVTALARATDADDYQRGLEALCKAEVKLENALSVDGPFFAGERYSLVDAGYAPFLQRRLLIDGMAGGTTFGHAPRLKGWAEALVARPSTHSFPPDEFAALYLHNLEKRGSWLARAATPHATHA
jgi:glutathione S-transferase